MALKKAHPPTIIIDSNAKKDLTFSILKKSGHHAEGGDALELSILIVHKLTLHQNFVKTSLTALYEDAQRCTPSIDFMPTKKHEKLPITGCDAMI